MLKHNFIYELKVLLRSRWIQLLSVLLLILFGFSVYNGIQKTDKRNLVIKEATLEVEKNDATMLALLDSVASGLQVSVPRWTIPNSPMAVGNYYPRIAAMQTQPFGFVATGQSDIFTPYVKPTVAGDDFTLNFTEMTSPVQLLFGSFDLAFVIIYLLPLLIIAFSYNVLSSEKESGTLPLLMSQPITIRQWVLQKIGLRFFWLSVLVVCSITLVFLIFGIDFTANLKTFFAFQAFVVVYMLFWFVLAFLVNLVVGTSAKNAVSMLVLWVVFVLLVPSVLNQISTSLYPIPSRTLMINEMRVKKAEVAKKQDEILDNFLRDHPEYAINDTTQSRGFYHRYMASQKLVKQELLPIVEAYETQLFKQQKLTSQLKWLSPALSVQESLNALAGTSTNDYENYRKQVINFAETWRAHLIPFLYNNQEFTAKDVQALPTFTYKVTSFSTLNNITPILFISLAVFVLALVVTGRTYKSHKLSKN